MSTPTLPPPTRATIEDVLRFDGKAELIDGKVVPLMGAGVRHSRIGSLIYMSLFRYEKERGNAGFAFDDNLIFQVKKLLSRRESFSPDAAFFAGTLSLDDDGCVNGPPTLAVEVRSPEDYRPKGLREMAAKRDDYLEAGTLVIWDVDPRSAEITMYRADQPPLVFRRGDDAHAEPAVPGWTMKVDDIFGG